MQGKHTKEFAHLAKEQPAVSSGGAAGSASAGDWLISAEEKARYDESFNQLGPTSDDVLTGKKARKVLLKTGLPQEVLGKIWELADIDSDGNLDRDEFAIAMHLIRSCMNGKQPPDALSPDLMPPSKRKGAGAGANAASSAVSSPSPKGHETPPKAADPPAAVPSKAEPAAARPPTKSTSSPSGVDDVDWIVTPKELKTYDDFFKTADKDKDGKVSGGEIMKIFLTSKLPKDVLAHVWNLVDMDDSGEINSEQFALAMHFIAQKVKGKDVPKKLAPNMVPPSLRGTRGAAGGGGGGDAPLAAAPEGGTAAEVRHARETNAQLKKDIEETNSQIEVETGDLSALQAEIKELRAEEKRLRAELKAGKDKLVEVLEQKRKAKADKAKIGGKISTLKASKAKVESGLKSAGYYDDVGTGASPSQGGGVDMETHGMSMEDYFGAS